MRASRHLDSLLWFAWLVPLGTVWAAAPLTRIADIRSLSREQAAQSLPV